MSARTPVTLPAGVDLVALAWLRPLLDRQLAEAEARLVNAGRQGSSPAELLHCLWAVHHVSAALRSLGLELVPLLGLELERSLRQLLLEDIAVERRNLILGGVMRGLQTLPACLDSVEESGEDSGRGLAPCINDLRRWRGQAPRPPALFFRWPLAPACGLSSGPLTPDEEVRRAAGLLLAPWVQSARALLAEGDPRSAARTLGRIAHKLHQLFRGRVQERFWLGLVGLSEGLAVGMFLPDEAIAHILKAGALLIKQAREHGTAPLPSVNSDRYLQQILFYLAACPVRTLHMQHICEACGVDQGSVEALSRPPVHRDALCAVLRETDARLQSLMEQLQSDGLDQEEQDVALHGIERRLLALGELDWLQCLQRIRGALAGTVPERGSLPASAVEDLVGLQLALASRLHWRGRRVEDAAKLEDQQRLLSGCRNRLLGVMQTLDAPEPQSAAPEGDRDALETPVDARLGEIAAALAHAGREREASVLVLGRDWLRARGADPAGEDLARVAFAFACLECYWEAFLAEPRAADATRVDIALESLSHLSETETGGVEGPALRGDSPVEPGSLDEIPEALRAVFAEECAEQVVRLQTLLPAWEQAPARDEHLREMRRHFHTFKGNGLAVGAERIAALGREAQDMLDRVLESSGPLDPELAPLLHDLVSRLPRLISGDDPAVLEHFLQRCRVVQQGDKP
ncbi:Hpt domain-containing protein [Haliea atlantica]